MKHFYITLNKIIIGIGTKRNDSKQYNNNNTIRWNENLDEYSSWNHKKMICKNQYSYIWWVIWVQRTLVMYFKTVTRNYVLTFQGLRIDLTDSRVLFGTLLPMCNAISPNFISLNTAIASRWLNPCNGLLLTARISSPKT